MTAPIRLWIHGASHPAFRNGGWAYVRAAEGGVVGQAGGERAVTAQRMALTAFLAALRDLPKGEAVIVHLAHPAFLAVARRIGAGSASADDPTEDLDLWAQLIAAVQARPTTFVHADIRPQTPMAFVAAWADLAGDKAKATGKFSAAIPKPNLAKIAGLGPA